MFPLLEHKLGKSMACRDIHRRILAHVPHAYRPMARMVSSSFNAATEVSGVAAPFQEQLDAVRALIAASDVPALRYCERRFKWDLAGILENGQARWTGALKHAFRSEASVDAILYVHQCDVTVEHGHFENLICVYNREDVFNAFPRDYQGWSKKTCISAAVWDDRTWMLQIWLTRLGRKSKRMIDVWREIESKDENDIVDYSRAAVHWAIVNKIPFPENFDVSRLITAFAAGGAKNKRRSNFPLFVLLTNYARKKKVKIELQCVSLDNQGSDYYDEAYAARSMAFLKPKECVCRKIEIHKNRLE